MSTVIDRLIRYNPSRKRLEDFLQRCAREIPTNARVLDAGAGEGYYRDYFLHACYHATDFGKVEQKSYGQVDYISNLAQIPIRNDSYDFIICTQVFEHLPEPNRAIMELYRVLKPGGQLWFSTPLFFPEHEEPFDYFRYTQFGLRHLLSSVGFDVQEVEWLEGYFATVGYQLRMAGRSLPIAASAYGKNWLGFLAFPLGVAFKPLFYGLSLIFNGLEANAKYTQSGMCKNYCGVAMKPVSG